MDPVAYTIEEEDKTDRRARMIQTTEPKRTQSGCDIG